MSKPPLTKTGRTLLAGLLAISVAGVLVFGVRTTLRVIYWADPAHQQQPLEPWMTIGYVARSWNLPPHKLANALDLERPKGKPRTLMQISKNRGEPIDVFMKTIEATLADLEPGK